MYGVSFVWGLFCVGIAVEIVSAAGVIISNSGGNSDDSKDNKELAGIHTNATTNPHIIQSEFTNATINSSRVFFSQV